MNQAVPTKIKARDIAIGFFGWVILSNIVFLLLLLLIFSMEGNPSINIGYEHISLAMWLCSIISILILFMKKRLWIMTGVVAAVIINGISWMVMNITSQGNATLGQVIMITGFPLPIGLILFLGQ